MGEDHRVHDQESPRIGTRGGSGERLSRGVPLDLGVGSPEIGRQLPVPVQVPGRPVRQAVADLDMHDKQLRILGPG